MTGIMFGFDVLVCVHEMITQAKGYTGFLLVGR
jgi:hypothetical protein